MIRTAAALVLTLAAQAASAAAPHLDLRVELDPASGEFAAQVETMLTTTQPLTLALPGLEVQSLLLDDAELQANASDGRWTWTPDASAIGKRLRIAYRGRVAQMNDTLSHRDVLDALPPMVSDDGSYLPAASGWYPDPGAAFTYRIEVTTPQSQVAVAPGTPHDRSAMPGKRAVVFEHAFPVDGIELMVGPYTVSEKRINAAGKAVRLRTYFHTDVQSLAADYLDSATGYLQRYSREIGPYPYSDFSIVSSPLPTGFGMPTLTYLGRQVLKLPFIRFTSLGHEVLHNWWGNGVRVDVSRGNWCEGLTTFMADYAYKEEAGPEAAKDMRHGWLRDFAALPPGADKPLSEFRARHHTASSVVGYGKSAMLFVALRERLGDDVFNKALRQFWQTQRFRAAGFDDLRNAFEAVSGSDLHAFFDQWLDRTGAPMLKVTQAIARDNRIEVELTQDFRDYSLHVPLRLESAAGARDVTLGLDSTEARFAVPAARDARAVTLDPDFRVWRRLAPSEAPPILRDAVAADRLEVLALNDTVADATVALGRSLAEGKVQVAGTDADGSRAPLLVAGTRDAIDAWLALHALPPRAPEVATGVIQAWAVPAPTRHVVAVSLPADPESERAALASLSRRLPHLARYAWLTFEGERIAGRGNWPAQSPVIAIQR